MKFGEILFKLRKNKQMSQEELAEKVNVSRQSVSKWELGEAYPEMDNIFRLCKIFDCQISDLINSELADFNLFDEEIVNMEKGYERFLGYAATYDQGRPSLPGRAIEILQKFVDHKIEVIVDIGCGTSLSTKACENFASKVIGVEPSEDMLKIAKTKSNDKISFIKGFGDNTGLDDECADLVICSQAFHWMEPHSTIKEVNRILKKGGVFAVIDADYPPVIDLRLDRLNRDFHDLSVSLEDENKAFIYPKYQHFNNMVKSNLFDYCREIGFSSETKYNKERFKKFILSQSSTQKAIKNHYSVMRSYLENLDKILNDVFEDKDLNAMIPYKMRIGVK